MEKLYKYTCIFNVDKGTNDFTCEENDIIISENKQIVYKNKDGYFNILNLFEYNNAELKQFENKLGKVKINFNNKLIIAELYSLNEIVNYQVVLKNEIKKYIEGLL